MKFIKNIKNSLYNPDFYRGLKEESLGSSFKYFYGVVFCLSFLTAFVLGSMLSPLYSSENLRKLVSYYPEKLVLTLKGGVISNNLEEPYVIKNDEKRTLGRGTGNLIIIDTKNPFSRELYKQYDTAVWIGKDFVVTAKNSGRLELTDMSKAPDFVLSQEKLLSWAGVVGSYHLLLSLGLFFFLLVAFMLFWTAHLALFLLTALVVFFFAKLRTSALSFKNSYQIVLYAVTVPLIIETIFILGGINFPFPFFFSLITLIIVFLNLKEQQVTLNLPPTA